MKTLTVGKRLTAGFAAVVLVLCCVSAGSSLAMHNARNSISDVAQAYLPEVKLATTFEREILNARIHFIYHVTIQKPGELGKGWERFSKARALMPRLESAAEAPQLRGLHARTQQLARDLDEYEVALRAILNAVGSSQNHGPEFSALISRWAKLGGTLVEAAGDLNARSAALADDQCASQAAALARATLVTLTGCALAVGLAIAIAILLTRGISATLRQAAGSLHRAIESLAAAAQQVAGASQSLADGATEQASCMEETSASCEEISSMAKHNADAV